MLASVAVQSVQYSVNPVDGDDIASRCVDVMRGNKTPCVVDVISNIELAAIDPGAVFILTRLFAKSAPISGVVVLLFSILRISLSVIVKL